MLLVPSYTIEVYMPRMAKGLCLQHVCFLSFLQYHHDRLQVIIHFCIWSFGKGYIYYKTNHSAIFYSLIDLFYLDM